MTQTETKIDRFFKNYETNFNKGLAGQDIDSDVLNSFADCFIESSPAGVMCAKNSPEFLQKIRQGFEFYKNIGTTSMKIAAMHIEGLDSGHNLVKVGWHYEATKKDKSKVEIDFDIFYLLRTFNDEVKIFVYITGDEQKVLREKGLIPGTPPASGNH